MIESVLLFIKDWQQAYTILILMFFLSNKFKSLARALKFHRHTETGIPIDSNGNELFPDN